MKLLFLIVLIIYFSYIINADQVVNGCGKLNYEQPREPEQCRDSLEICCFVSLKKDSDTINFCFPAPDKMELDDVKKEVEENTGYTVEKLTCYDFAENLKYMIGNLILIGLILI